MVLNVPKDTAHNAMLGRKVQHPVSTKFHDDGIAPPSKRLKTFESSDGEDSHELSAYESAISTPSRFRGRDS